MLIYSGESLSWGLQSLMYGLAAGTAVAASNLLLIEAMTRIDVSLGSTIYRLNTIGVVVLSLVFLGETVAFTKLVAIVFGIAAALTLYGGTRGGAPVVQLFFWLAVLASALRALFGVVSKAALSAGVSKPSLLIISALCWVVLGLTYAALRERRVRVTVAKLKFSMVSGTLVFLVVNTLLWGLSLGDASTVIPIANLSFAVVLVVSVLMRMEVMTVRKGIAVALASACIYLMSVTTI